MSQYYISLFEDTWDQNLIMSYVAVGVYSLLFLFLTYQSLQLCFSSRTRKKTNKNLTNTILKTRATSEGLALAVGKLTEKLEYFEKRLDTFICNTDNVIKEIKIQVALHTERIDNVLSFTEENKIEMNDIRNKVKNKLKGIRNDFNLIDQAVGNFADEEYMEFKEYVKENLRLHHDALFVPDEDDTSDEYME